jgi:hypothetical protein
VRTTAAGVTATCVTATCVTANAARCAPFEYGVICAVVKSAAGFFSDVKCEFVIFSISQMFLAG